MTITEQPTTIRKPKPRSSDVDFVVGARLRAQRILAGLSQTQLASATGVTYQQLHKYETGENRISCGRLVTIAHALGVGLAAFFEDGDYVRIADEATERTMLELFKCVRNLKPHQQALLRTIARALAERS